jgi:hypothetical protein
VRADNVGEEGVVLAAFQTILSASLLVCPTRREVFRRSQVVVDNCAFAKRWSDNLIASADQYLEQLLQMLSFDNNAVSDV